VSLLYTISLVALYGVCSIFQRFPVEIETQIDCRSEILWTDYARGYLSFQFSLS